MLVTSPLIPFPLSILSLDAALSWPGEADLAVSWYLHSAMALALSNAEKGVNFFFFSFLFFFPLGQSLVLITQECEGHMHMPPHAYERQVLVLLTLEVRCDYARQTFLALTGSSG